MKQSKNHRQYFALLIVFIFSFVSLFPHHSKAYSEFYTGAEDETYDASGGAAFRNKCIAIAKNVADVATSTLGVLADSTMGKCVKEIFKGAWGSTGGMVTGGLETAGAAIGNTAGCLSNSSYCATNLIDKVRNTANYVSEFVGKLKSVFANMSSEQLISLACNILSSLGTPTLLTIVTGGAAAGLAGANIARIAMLLQKLASLGPIESVMKLINLPFDIMMKLTDSAMNRIVALIQKDPSKAAAVREAVMSCSL